VHSECATSRFKPLCLGIDRLSNRLDGEYAVSCQSEFFRLAKLLKGNEF
jgi:hypothetical protein